MRKIRDIPTSVNRRAPTYAEVKAAAHGLWDVILPALLQNTAFLNRREGPCPGCVGTTRYRYDDRTGNGDYLCSHCGPGDGFKLLQLVNGWTSGQALRAVLEYLNIGGTNVVPVPRKAPEIHTEGDGTPEVNQTAKKANAALWSSATHIRPGDPVYEYLQRRAIRLEAMPDCLRIHPALIYWTKHPQLGWIEDGQYPAMIAKVVAADGQMVAVHKTYLTSDGRKVAIPAAKKLSKALYRGALNGAAIRLFHAGETLAVAEGIETALAVHLLGDLPVWSTITANGMERLTVPVHTKKLIIAADNDASGRGLQAAQRLADRYASTKEVKIITPPQPGTDWADVLLDEASNHGST